MFWNFLPGTYTCVASTSAGTDTKTGELTVEGIPPEIIVEPSDRVRLGLHLSNLESREFCTFLSSFLIISDCDGGDEDRVAVHRHGSTGAEARLVQCEFLAGRFFVMAKQDVTRKYATWSPRDENEMRYFVQSILNNSISGSNERGGQQHSIQISRHTLGPNWLRHLLRAQPSAQNYSSADKANRKTGSGPRTALTVSSILHTMWENRRITTKYCESMRRLLSNTEVT